MIMILNDLLTKQSLLIKLLLDNGNKELPKELKVKIMRIRMAYSKIMKRFEEENKEFSEALITDEFRTLRSLSRNEEQNKRYIELVNKFNSEYKEYLIQKGNEEIIDRIDDTFTIEEYSEIVDVNSGNNIEINGNKILAADFLEIIYELFVKE